MAANFIKSDKTKDVPRNVDAGLRKIVEGLEQLLGARAVLIQQRDGDGSQASHYDTVATEGGFSAVDYADANAAAKAYFDELDSLLAKLNTDDSVSFVRAALYQATAKFGVIVA